MVRLADEPAEVGERRPRDAAQDHARHAEEALRQAQVCDPRAVPEHTDHHRRQDLDAVGVQVAHDPDPDPQAQAARHGHDAHEAPHLAQARQQHVLPPALTHVGVDRKQRSDRRGQDCAHRRPDGVAGRDRAGQHEEDTREVLAVLHTRQRGHAPRPLQASAKRDARQLEERRQGQDGGRLTDPLSAVRPARERRQREQPEERRSDPDHERGLDQPCHPGADLGLVAPLGGGGDLARGDVVEPQVHEEPEERPRGHGQVELALGSRSQQEREAEGAGEGRNPSDHGRGLEHGRVPHEAAPAQALGEPTNHRGVKTTSKTLGWVGRSTSR